MHTYDNMFTEIENFEEMTVEYLAVSCFLYNLFCQGNDWEADFIDIGCIIEL